MIAYKRGACNIPFRVLQIKGSVFPLAACVALPGATASFILKWLMDEGMVPELTRFEDKSVVRQSAIWSSFIALVGFLIVFRTSQAYARFWDGCTCTHQMRAEWFDAASSIIAFCKHTRSPVEQVVRFEHTLIRLFSMLHAVALAEIEDSSSDDVQQIAAFKYELVDVASLDKDTLQEIKDSNARVELVFQWIQQLVVENIVTGVVSIPPPLLSRTFQELANGMCQFHEAIKISTIPFPFPYAQTCDMLLIMQYVMTPVVSTQFAAAPVWAATFAFIQIFVLWTLNFTAVEIENPFGFDPNDIDAEAMQLELNQHLLLLLSPVAKRVPYLDDMWTADKLKRPEQDDVISRKVSLSQVWTSMTAEDEAKAARTGRCARFGRVRTHHRLFEQQDDVVGAEGSQGTHEFESEDHSPPGQQLKADGDHARSPASMAVVAKVAAQLQAKKARPGVQPPPDQSFSAQTASRAGEASAPSHCRSMHDNGEYHSPVYKEPDYHDMEGMRRGNSLVALEEARVADQQIQKGDTRKDSTGARSRWALPLSMPPLSMPPQSGADKSRAAVVEESARPPSEGGFPAGDDDALSLDGYELSPPSRQAPPPRTVVRNADYHVLPISNL